MSETWKPIPIFPYEVSNTGNVRRSSKEGARNTYAGRPLKGYIDSYGYKIVSLCMNGKPHYRKVHRLVADAFECSGDGREIRHLDGNPLNNVPSNLVYGTSKENAADRKKHGRSKYRCVISKPLFKVISNFILAEVKLRNDNGFIRLERKFWDKLSFRFRVNKHTVKTRMKKVVLNA